MAFTDSKSKVKNKKQFDETLDELKKKKKESKAVKAEVAKCSNGHGIRYHYK